MNSISLRSKITHSTKRFVHLELELIIDGHPVEEFSEYSVSLRALQDTIDQDGEHFILTCECGEPGCAGLLQGIRTRRGDGVIHWRLAEPFPQRTLQFEIQQYQRSLEQAQSMAQSCLEDIQKSGKKAKVAPLGEEPLWRAG